MQPVEDQPHIKTEETADDQHLKSDLRIVDDDVGRVQEVVAYSSSSKESRDPVEVISLASPNSLNS